ncbi:MAG: DUF881 domain-containing protein [Ruminococcaceae bacterium]|nr:DUF881 domain-containing protein [Oscillospiraceae bacterium]
MEENKKKTASIVYNVALTVVCIVLGIVISVQYRSLSASGSASADAEKIAMYQSNILKLEQELNTLETENEELSDKVELLESATNEEQIEKLSEELNNIKKFSGVTKVEGEGLYISISLKGEMLSATLQRHLLSLINELKASSAQAISINGERLTAMSEIRIVGQYVIINGRQHSAPFEIYAIGEPEKLYSGVYLNGTGPLGVLNKEKACEVSWQMRENIVLEGCNPLDINTDMLKNAE